MAELPKIIFKWEYKKIWGRELTEALLNDFGDQGWELVYHEGNITIFKRPKLEAAYLDADEVEERVKRILERERGAG